jgi:hypothetical protein
VLELSNCHEQVKLLVAHLQGSHHCVPVNIPRPASHANLPGIHKLLNHLYAAEAWSAEDSFEGIPSVAHSICRLQALHFRLRDAWNAALVVACQGFEGRKRKHTVVGLFAQVDDNKTGATVYSLHEPHLLALLNIVLLINADGISPE